MLALACRLKQGPTRHWPMAHRILNMPNAVTNCHNVLQACFFSVYMPVQTYLFLSVCETITDAPNRWSQGHGLPTARAMAKIAQFLRSHSPPWVNPAIYRISTICLVNYGIGDVWYLSMDAGTGRDSARSDYWLLTLREELTTNARVLRKHKY